MHENFLCYSGFMGYIFLFIALILNTAANTMMKSGASNLAYFKEYGPINGLLKNYIILIGILFFAVNVIFYILALSKINLSVAYPIMTIGGLLLITIFSYIFFKETLTPGQIVGVLFLAAGVVLTVGKF